MSLSHTSQSSRDANMSSVPPRKELERCRPLTEQELQAIVSGEVECERVRGEGVRAALMERVKEREKAYHELEEEFRTALRLEAGRYQEVGRAVVDPVSCTGRYLLCTCPQLQESYKSVCEEVEVCRQTAVSAVQREQRVTDMVAELTAIVCGGTCVSSQPKQYICVLPPGPGAERSYF